MKRVIQILFLSFLWVIFQTGFLYAEIRVKIKDIAYIDGLKENQVIGFGLVVGLQGTGDSSSLLIQSSLKNLLKNLGIEDEEGFKSKNIAAVLLTATLPPFVRVGDRVDVKVSSIADAKSMIGGILIQSQLKGADDKTYVVAQGQLTFDLPRRGGKSIKTVAQIIDGGIIERSIESDIVVDNNIFLVLKNWDFSVANQIIKSISEEFPWSGSEIATGGRIRINLPEEKNVEIVEFVSSIENIEVVPYYKARVVVNEKDGTIVMGGDVKISEVVVSKDGMTVKVEDEGTGGSVAVLKEAATVKDLVDSLTYIGASTRDIISILKALKKAGALHAELIIM